MSYTQERHGVRETLNNIRLKEHYFCSFKVKEKNNNEKVD